MAEDIRYTYDEIEQIVQNYQAGWASAAETLINAFSRFLFKFVNLIKGGAPITVDDASLRKFIALYMNNPFARRSINSIHKQSRVRAEALKSVEFIRGLFEPYSEEEIYHELIIVLLTLAKRYKSPDGNPRFHLYLQKTFHYAAFNALRALTRDPLWQEWDNADILAEDFMPPKDSEPHYFAVDDLIENIDDNWVLGHTVSEEFSELSILERKVIKMYYQDGYTDEEVGDRLGMSRAAIQRIRSKAKKKIRYTPSNT
jgi:RNA polymerase sigma factor (sigma-70 family)